MWSHRQPEHISLDRQNHATSLWHLLGAACLVLVDEITRTIIWGEHRHLSEDITTNCRVMMNRSNTRIKKMCNNVGASGSLIPPWIGSVSWAWTFSREPFCNRGDWLLASYLLVLIRLPTVWSLRSAQWGIFTHRIMDTKSPNWKA